MREARRAPMRRAMKSNHKPADPWPMTATSLPTKLGNHWQAKITVPSCCAWSMTSVGLSGGRGKTLSAGAT